MKKYEHLPIDNFWPLLENRSFFQPSDLVRFSDLQGYHIYADMQLNLDVAAAEDDRQAMKCVDLLEDFTVISDRCARLVGARILEVQGDRIHFVLPARDPVADLGKLLLFSSALTQTVYQEIKPAAGDDWQAFSMADRIGSPNARIQLVNFWPNMELEEYINLEQRVSGRMVLLDISATGEENIIEQQTNNQMNDLEYRRKQLLKLQDAVIDLEDLSSGVSITDLTLNDFRIDLARFLKDNFARFESLPFGTFAVTTTHGDDESAIPPGVIFCLRAVGAAAMNAAEPGYPLAPHYLVHVGDDGAVLLAFTQAKQVLDRLKKLCIGRDLTDDSACARFDRATRHGENMSATQQLLAKAVASVVGKKEERAVASLFTPGGAGTGFSQGRTSTRRA